MFIRVDLHSGVPVFRQIMEQVEHLIVAGQLGSGEQITSVRDLSKQVRVNPMTVSKAYAFLERDGLLERRRGMGLFVAPRSNKDKEKERQKLLVAVVEELVTKSVALGSNKDELHALIEHH